MKKARVYDEAFKQMAIELSEAKGSVKGAAEELGLDPSRLSKWRARNKRGDLRENSEGLSEEQKKIRRLEKELKEIKLEHEILKKAVSIFSRGDRSGSNS